MTALAKLARRGFDLGARDWYPRASLSMHRVARETGYHADVACDVVAVTSPLRSVRDNLNLARALLGLRDPADLTQLGRGLPPSTARALAHYWRTGEVRGPKVGAFAQALRGDTGAVVLDRHMARALAGVDALSGRAYRYQAQRVRRLARYVGETPRETQAAVWLAWRESQGLKPVFMGG